MSGPPPPPPPVVPVASADAVRDAAATASAALSATITRAASFSDDELGTGVNDEWSTVQSFRHMVLVIDLWLSKMVLGIDDPFHPMALPPSFMPPQLPGTSIDPDANPTFGEACTVLRQRMATVGAYAESVTADDLARTIPGHAGTVAGGLGVLFQELGAHDHFVNRDLDVIEAAR